jgi:hypothetical protein
MDSAHHVILGMLKPCILVVRHHMTWRAPFISPSGEAGAGERVRVPRGVLVDSAKNGGRRRGGGRGDGSSAAAHNQSDRPVGAHRVAEEPGAPPVSRDCARTGRGVIESKQSTEFDPPRPPHPTRVCRSILPEGTHSKS